MAKATSYLYDFYRKERRGLVQAPRERRGGAITGSHPAELVLTGFLSVDRQSQMSRSVGSYRFCCIVSFSLGSVNLVCMLFKNLGAYPIELMIVCELMGLAVRLEQETNVLD